MNIDIILIIFFFMWSIFNTNFIFIRLIILWDIISCWYSIIIVIFSILIPTREVVNVNIFLVRILFADGWFIAVIFVMFFTSCCRNCLSSRSFLLLLGPARRFRWPSTYVPTPSSDSDISSPLSHHQGISSLTLCCHP